MTPHTRPATSASAKPVTPRGSSTARPWSISSGSARPPVTATTSTAAPSAAVRSRSWSPPASRPAPPTTAPTPPPRWPPSRVRSRSTRCSPTAPARVPANSWTRSSSTTPARCRCRWRAGGCPTTRRRTRTCCRPARVIAPVGDHRIQHVAARRTILTYRVGASATSTFLSQDIFLDSTGHNLPGNIDFGIGKGGDNAALVAPDGTDADRVSFGSDPESLPWPPRRTGNTISRCPDGTGAWALSFAATLGATNVCGQPGRRHRQDQRGRPDQRRCRTDEHQHHRTRRRLRASSSPTTPPSRSRSPRPTPLSLAAAGTAIPAGGYAEVTLGTTLTPAAAADKITLADGATHRRQQHLDERVHARPGDAAPTAPAASRRRLRSPTAPPARPRARTRAPSAVRRPVTTRSASTRSRPTATRSATGSS